MPLAKDVALELRKLADSLDKQPDAEITQPWITFYEHQKERFLATARLLPRPLTKDEDYDSSRFRLIYDSFDTSIHIECSVDKSTVCTLIEPAKPAVYKCVSILIDDELETMSQ